MTDKEISGIWEAYQQVHSQVEEVEQLDEDFAGKVDAFLKKGGEVLKKVPGAQAALTPAGPVRKTPTKESGGYRPVVKSVANEEFEQVDEDKKYDRNRQRAAQRAAARNEARRQGKTGSVPGVGYVSPRPERETYRDSAGVERHKTGARMPQKEEVDLFDTILEHLVAEGYADTEEAATAIMANMSEEWRQSIINENLGNFVKRAGEAIRNPQRALHAAASSITRRLEGPAPKPTPDDPRLVDVSTADKAAKNLPGSRVYQQRQQQMKQNR